MVIEKEIGELLRSRHLTMGTAESCTGGTSDYTCGWQFRLLLWRSRFLQQ